MDGKLDAFEARWSFEPLAEGGLLVEYAIHIEPAVPSPRLLVRHYLRKRLPDLLACLRGLARASGPADQARNDLARCPGEPPGGDAAAIEPQ